MFDPMEIARAWTNGWVWIAGAAAVALIELLLPGWVFVSTAITFAATGMAMLWFTPWPFSLPMTLLIMAIQTGVVWMLLWWVFPNQRGSARVWKTDING